MSYLYLLALDAGMSLLQALFNFSIEENRWAELPNVLMIIGVVYLPVGVAIVLVGELAARCSHRWRLPGLLVAGAVLAVGAVLIPGGGRLILPVGYASVALGAVTALAVWRTPPRSTDAA